MLHGVPNPKRAHNSCVGHGRERAKRNKSTDAQMSANDLGRAHPQEDRSREKTYALQQTVVRHYDKVCLEQFLRDGEKLVQNRVTKCAFGGGCLHCLDAGDCIDLV